MEKKFHNLLIYNNNLNLIIEININNKCNIFNVKFNGKNFFNNLFIYNNNLVLTDCKYSFLFLDKFKNNITFILFKTKSKNT